MLYNLKDTLSYFNSFLFFYLGRYCKKPKKENAAKIWHHKLSFLNEKECLELASQFEFSGGEMENIARKCVMYKILHEKNPNFEEVHSLCINEKWDTDRNRVKIGF